MIGRAYRLLRAARRNRRGVHDLPRLLTYTVTFGCNARCIMCDSWKLSTQGDLTIDEIARVFAQLPRMDAVRLTGGEPFVRDDFPEIARLAVRTMKPLLLHVTTNGFLTERIAHFCETRARGVPLELLISIDGERDKHNQIRGHSKAYDLAFQTVRELAPRRKELNLRLAVNQTVVDAEGAEQYHTLRELLRPLGVHNHLVMAYDASATYSLERDVDLAPTEIGEFATFGAFDRLQIESLLDEAERDLAGYPFWQRIAKRYYLRGIRNRLLHEQGAPNPPCVALNSHLRIYPNGDVPTCQFNSQIVGNLRTQSFSDLWASARRREQREWVQRCAGCWAECEVLPSAIYSLDLLKETIRPGNRGATPRPVRQLPEPSSQGSPALVELKVP